jgi:anti-sigma factor ChrR (cupin superfamily)
MMAIWHGRLDVDLGRHPVTFAGTKPIEVHTLPKALQFLNKSEFNWAIGGGRERDVYIELAESSRILTLKYEVNAIPVDRNDNVAFEMDYFLSNVFILDQAVQGG